MEMKERFAADGFVVVPNLLMPDEVGAARAALSALVAQWSRSSPSDRQPPRLFIEFEKGFDPNAPDLSPAEIEMKVRKYMGFAQLDDALGRLTRPGHRAYDLVAELIGDDPILFQDMALVKPPMGREKPWHQDNAYFCVAPLDSVCGVWIALDDADEGNGCMHVIPGGHRRGAYRHYHGSDCEIVSGRLDPGEVVPVPVPAGGAMFFYGMLPHQTPPNSSPRRRRALQYHYRSKDSRIVAQEEYDRLYAEADGTPASCDAARRQGTL